jgi:hypothetical protein
MRYVQVLITTVLLLAIFTLSAFGREITLQWEPSPSPGVIGYKVYYQKDAPKLPLSGTEADQGSSPIDVENSLMASISGLQENAVYYFSVTAYDSNNAESTFSNIVSTSMMLLLHKPQKESIIVPWNATFEWDAGPPEHYLNYTLYYATDKDQIVYAGAAPSNFVSFLSVPWLTPTQNLLIVIALLVMLTMLLVADKRDRRIIYLQRTAVAGLFVFSLVACGSGGGGGSNWSSESFPVSPTTLMRVDNGNNTSYQTDDLQSGTTYYWKVEAQSITEPDTVFHSEVYSFTTE